MRGSVIKAAISPHSWTLFVREFRPFLKDNALLDKAFSLHQFLYFALGEDLIAIYREAGRKGSLKEVIRELSRTINNDVLCHGKTTDEVFSQIIKSLSKFDLKTKFAD